MSEKSSPVEVNANFHHAAGADLFKNDDPTFVEYRKKWKEWPETLHVGEAPLFIDVEAASVCNLKCPFCATTFRKDRILKGFMSFDTLKRVIGGGIEDNLYGVKFNIRGEPLLHPQIHEFVGYAKQKGLIDVYFNTNALLLTEEMSLKLIEAGLDRLSVSFEGHTKEVYEKNRVGSSFEKVLENIETLQRLKRKLGIDRPLVRVQTVLIDEVAASLEEYVKFWSVRADEVGVLDYKEMKEKKKGVPSPWICPQIWQRMAVWWDGTILPCNHDDDALLALGNVRDISMRDAWHSPKASAIREKHIAGNAHEAPACDGCYLRDSEIRKKLQLMKLQKSNCAI